MAGRILIVEGTASHRILLRARLTSAFYEVLVAETGSEALAMIEAARPDLVLAAAELPDMCGSGFCTRLRALPDHADTPLVLLTEEDLVDERLALLAVGADDVIARAVEDILLLARLRSLLRRSRAQDEIQLRTDAKRALGLSEAPRSFQRPARVALVSLDPGLGLDTIAARLRVGIGAQVQITAPGTLLQSGAISAEVAVLFDTGAEPGAGLALLSQLRTARAQHRAVLVYVTNKGRDEAAARALDLGADEVLHNGPEALELALRLPRLIGRRRRSERHRAALRNGLRAAMIDPLTGLYNRRYALPEIARRAQQAAQRGQPLALLVADLDHFKKVNDRWGHAAGDQVLVATAQRLTAGRCDLDLVARLGGEEFLIALPGADTEAAFAAARRLCEEVARLSLPMPMRRAGRPPLFSPTISIGIALMEAAGEAVETALLRADGALYAAKHAGRNRAHVAPPAAFSHGYGALRGA
ncbi:diguanylate cyclase [Yangia mangrovi]|uniref:diguanylate cyclase n=2 Tax=Alloyangia mangrovi TaxID=1779329 RepID=A0ABT2KJZ9_9RHOB|nr:diguanylate cyclase [Alloyangia mangrovi]MCT4370691.1 diguanylate cyclase [Alloyangia mangrovi]